MAESTLWWLAAGSLIVVELISGTFYLLLISLGLAAAALSAHAGVSTPFQWICAAMVGGGSVLAWRAYKRTQPGSAPAQANHDVNLDIGETVHVDHWLDDRTSSVKYRGVHWDVILHHSESAENGAFVIAEIIGNRLVLKKSHSS